MMRILIYLILFLFTPALSSAADARQPALIWWFLHNQQGQSADIDKTGAWIAILQFGDTPFRNTQPFPAKSMDSENRLSAWVRHASPESPAAPLLPRKSGYTVPPGKLSNGGITLLGARYQGEEEQFSGSSTPLQTMLYPKAIIADHNPCTAPAQNTALSLNLQEIPLEIIPVRTAPKRTFLNAASWRFIFKVQYMGRPLAGCPITIHTADDRTLNMTTSEHGFFTVASQEERPVTERWEHYLFTATWFDSDRNTEHTATLKVIAPPPNFRTGNMLRRGLYMGVALVILVFASLMAAMALTPDKDTPAPRQGRR